MGRKWAAVLTLEAAKGETLGLDALAEFLEGARDAIGDTPSLVQVMTRLSGEVQRVRISHNLTPAEVRDNAARAHGLVGQQPAYGTTPAEYARRDFEA